MCGITALVKSANVSLPEGVLRNMNDAVAHRGPDGHGLSYWSGTSGAWRKADTPMSDWQVGLGHRRLSILDLSEQGKQPMQYMDRYEVVFNGEIYNYVELRDRLHKEGYSFTSTGDTEVILAAYAAWGTKAFAELRGMWAIIIFDSVRGELVVSRDRMGIKPLFVWHEQDIWAFASEIKQFESLPYWQPTLHPEAAVNYLTTGFERTGVPFFQQVSQISPGTFRVMSVPTRRWKEEEAYWHPEQVKQTVSSRSEAGEQFAQIFDESVRLHLRSDVPVGAQLSGGLDSSSIMMLMNTYRAPDQAIHSFTTQFPGYEHDETEYVEEVLAQTKAEPHFDTPTPEQFLSEFARFMHHHDEPTGSLTHFANFSLANTIHRAGIKVVLNGQGGDELLGGYWQTYMAYLARATKDIKPWAVLRHLAGAVMPSGNQQLLPQVLHMYRRYRNRTAGGANQLPWKHTLDAGDDLGQVASYLQLSETERRVYDIREMLLPRLLKWDDRNLMAYSVEGRYPLLDHKLIETCLSFDSRTLYKDGWTKWPMREGLKQVLPAKILQRKSKVGYVTPQEQWLFHDLRPHLEKWMSSERPIWQLLDPQGIKKQADQFWSSPANARAKGAIQNETGQMLFRLYAFDTWMEVRNVTLP